jgi:5'-nucleotidase / UDP-sugar diphosphatase
MILFLMKKITGLQVVYNLTKPEGQRVVSAIVGDPATGAPLDVDKYYQVIAPAYLADGGDGFSV